MNTNLNHIRHSLAHLLALAVREKDKNVKLAIGPAIQGGFYYDFEFSKDYTPTLDDLPLLEARMKELCKKNLRFEGREVSEKEARALFKDQPYKLELIDRLVEKKEALSVYSVGNFTDLCKGGHVHVSGDIPSEAFALGHLAGAYWRGDEKNTMLTRIYGVSFETEDALRTYEARQEEAKKRDHKKLGKELDLFVFSEQVGPGLPLWTPKGTLLRGILDDFVWELREKKGYMRVEIPHITKKDLYITSGHWDKFKDELFKIETREGHTFAMKPMNCPHHVEIYKRKLHSYRELPVRFANTTMCYRDEQTGELNGLSRTRAFTQDDAHVFCRVPHIKEEILHIWDIIDAFYGAVGFPLQVRLSLHDPSTPDKYLGDEGSWKEAESSLRKLVGERAKKAHEAVGEAAFYGPKIDFMTTDSLGREWQVATIQLDMNLPERFNLMCINESGKQERIVMIHAAIMGSIERYLSILIEHLAGAFPLWLAPTQVALLPITENQHAYAKDIEKELLHRNIRVEFRGENETLGKRIREVKLQKIPYYIIIGEKEVKEGILAVESRGAGAQETMPLAAFVEKLKDEIASRR